MYENVLMEGLHVDTTADRKPAANVTHLISVPPGFPGH
jgi:hypothetical protein